MKCNSVTLAAYSREHHRASLRQQLQRPQYQTGERPAEQHITTLARHNTCTSQHLHVTTLARHNTCTSQHLHVTTLARHHSTQVTFLPEDTRLFESIVPQYLPGLAPGSSMSVLQGDICQFSLHGCSAIVNAANTEVQFGAGVSGAIAKGTACREADQQGT